MKRGAKKFRCKAVLFDLWGTLAFSRGKRKFVRRVKHLAGFPVEQHGGRFARVYEKTIHTKKYPNDRAAISALFRALKLKPSKKEFEGSVRLYVEMREDISAFPETEKVLSELKGKGFALGLVTNTATFRRNALQRLGIGKHFGAVVNSAEEGTIKPKPKIFRIALERLGAKPGECVMVGDKPRTDVKGARRAGLRVILVDRKDRFAGSGGASAKIKSLKELLALLELE